VFFSGSKYSKTHFRLGLCPGPRWGSLRRSAIRPSQLGRGTPHPFPHLLQPQLLNNWLSVLTLFFIKMKQRLLTISVNTRYSAIFACLYWKSQGKVSEFHVVWKVVTLLSVCFTDTKNHVLKRWWTSLHLLACMLHDKETAAQVYVFVNGFCSKIVTYCIDH